jgi:hypothetical protein
MAPPDSPRAPTILERIAFFSVMLLPLLLLHAHGIAEVAIGITDLCFLMRCAFIGDWAWLRIRWLWVAGLWWIWLVFCSLPIPGTALGEGGMRSLIQALVTVRFLLLVVAMEWLVLAHAERMPLDVWAGRGLGGVDRAEQPHPVWLRPQPDRLAAGG